MSRFLTKCLSSMYLCKRKISSMKISDIYKLTEIDKNVTVKGWIRSIRNMRKTIFFDLNDGSTYRFLQVVVKKTDLSEKIWYGASVEVIGRLKLSPSGQLELQTVNISIIGTHNSNDGYPFGEGIKYLPEEQREFLHLRPRTRTSGSALRIRSGATHFIHDFFRRKNFINIHTPILTSNDCEGAGEIFKVLPHSDTLLESMKKPDKNDDESFFDTTTFLTVSGQLHLEIMARSLGNVYQFGPTFRAENNKSRYHLTEFYMVEAELAFLNTIEELTQFIEEYLKSVIKDILDTHEKEITYYRNLLSLPEFPHENILKPTYHIMNHEEAVRILKENSHKFSHLFHNSKHLTKEHELFLIKRNNNVPIFLVNWPEDHKPFYVKALDDEQSSQVAAVDLLFPEVGELCGGSLREDNYEILQKKLIQLNMLEKLEWYLDLRKYGNIPTGGFGMGFERFLKVLLGTKSVKDTIPFPRWPHSCRL